MKLNENLSILLALFPLFFIIGSAALIERFGNTIIMPTLIIPGWLIMLNREGKFDSLKRAFKKPKL